MSGADILAWITKAGDVNWLSIVEPPPAAGPTGVDVPGLKATGQAGAELRTLALDRSRRIKGLLVQTGQVEDTRVFLLDVDDEGKLEDGRVRLDFKLTD